MDAENLKATVAELERELSQLKTVDDESRRLLEEEIRDIRAALDERQRTELARRRGRLQDILQTFEISHPTLTGILSRLIDGLGQIGI